MTNNLQGLCNIFSYEIFDLSDLANSFDLKAVINSFNVAKEYFIDYDFSKEYDLNVVADYYLVKKICNFRKLLPYVTDEYRDKMGFLEYFEEILNKFQEDNIADFYNCFDFNIPSDYYGLIFVVYKDLPKRLGKLDESTYEKAFNACPYLVLDYYSKYNNVLSKYKVLYKVLFSDEHLNAFISSFDSRFIEVAKRICKDQHFFDNDLKNKIIGEFVKLADTIIANTDIKNALQYQIWYKSLIEFLKDISYPEYDKYKSAQKDVEAQSDKWLHEYGHEFSFEIPVGEMKKQFDDPKTDPAIKQIYLTHTKNGQSFVHYCAPAMVDRHDAIFDLFSTPNAHNKHFPLSVIQALSTAHQIYLASLQVYLTDDKHRNDFLGVKKGFIEFIYNALDMNAKTIENQILLLDNNIEKYVSLLRKKSITLDDKEQARDCGWKVVQFIESFLREIYVAIKNERKEFCDKEKLKLGNLIDYRDSKNAFKGIFPDEFLQYLNFILTVDKDDDDKTVGFNIRNNLAHDNQSVEDYNIINTLLCILLLTGIINSLFIYYNEVIGEREKQEQKKRDRIASIIKRQNEDLLELQKLQDEANAMRKELSDAHNNMMAKIVYPSALQAFANGNVSKEELKDVEKIKALKEFLSKYIKENLEGTTEYDNYKKILAQSDNKEIEFCLKFLKYYIDIDSDRKELFSLEYAKAIDDLASEGLFFNNLRTPDIPKTLLLNTDSKKRSEELAELYSMQLRKIYGNILRRGDLESKNISEIIDCFEDENFEDCNIKLVSIIKPEISNLEEAYSYYNSKDAEFGPILFKIDGETKSLEYYIAVVQKLINYWHTKLSDNLENKDQIKSQASSKLDCVKLLLMYSNIKEMVSLFAATNFLLKYKDYLPTGIL